MAKIILLAGGQGTRLWPISTPEKPKQFHALGTKHSLLRETFLRVKDFGLENIFVITLAEQEFLVKEELHDLYENHIICAPLPQDSAMGIAYTIKALEKFGVHKDETLIFLPADHVIEPADAFCKFLKEAEQINQEHKDSLMTVGITPTEAATQFGYIQTSPFLSPPDKGDLGGLTQLPNSKPHSLPLSGEQSATPKIQPLKVEQFLEKPNKEKAEQLLKQGNVLWNAGFVIGTQGRLIEAFEKHAPEFLEATESLEKFQAAPRISFDYAIWEKEENILCIPSNNQFSWNDIGSWTEIPNLNERQQVIEENSKNNVVLSQSKKTVVLLGMEDCIVIEGENGILVAKKSELGNLKEALKKIN